jgi:tape measure domain-containing protein
MAANQRVVDLLIRAKLEGLRDVESVSKSINNISRKIDEQTKSVRSSKDAYDALKTAKGSLAATTSEISTLNSLIARYEAVSKTVNDLSKKYKEAQTRLNDYSATLAKSNAPTDTQINKQNRLEASLNNTAKRLREQKDVQKAYQSELDRVGLSTNNLEQSQKRLSSIMQHTGEVSLKLKTSLNAIGESSDDFSVLADMEARAAKEAKALQVHLQATARAAKAVRDGDYIRFWAQSLDEAEDKANKIRVAAEALGAAFMRQQGVAKTLTQTNKNLKTGQDQLGTSTRRLADETKRVTNEQAKLEPSSRTSLSIYQRIRGQVLGLTSAYIGLFGAMNFGNGVIEKYNEKQRTLTRLTLGTGGDKNKAMQEYKYVEEQARRLGVLQSVAAEGYSKVLASKALLNRDPKEAKFIFETVTELGKTAGLTGDRMNDIYTALTQIDSKGRVMAEEFRSQLGEAIPGLTGIAKEATAGLYKDFDKAMKDGRVTIDDLMTIFDTYRQKIQGVLPDTLDNLEAKQNRLTNAIDRFKVSIGEGGFAKDFSALITQITDWLNSPEGAEFGKGLVATFSALFEVLKVIAPYIKLITQSLLTWIGIRTVMGLVVDMKALGAAAIVAYKNIAMLFAYIQSAFAASGTLAAIGFFGKYFFGAAGAAYVGWQIGEILKDIFPQLETWGIKVIAWLDRLVIKAKYTALAAWNTTKDIIFRRVGGDGAKQREAELLQEYNQALEVSSKAEEDAIKRAEARRKAKSKSPAAPGNMPIGITPKPLGGDKPSTDLSDAEKKKIQTLMDRINDQLNNIENQVQKKTADTLAEKIGAIEGQYKNLIDDINKVPNKNTRAGFKTRLETARNALMEEATQDADRKILEAREKLWSDLDAVDAEAGKKNAQTFAERVANIPDEVRARFRQQVKEIADLRKLLSDSIAGGATPDSVYSSLAELDTREKALDTSMREIEAAQTRIKYMGEAERQMKVLSDLEDARNAKLRILEIQKDSGAITEYQMIERTAELVRNTQPAIDAAAASLMTFIDNNREAFGPEAQTEIDKMIAKIEEIKGSSQGMRTAILSAQQLNEMFANSAINAFEGVAASIGNFITGLGTLKDVGRAVFSGLINIVADLLKEIAVAIIRIQILNALKNMGGGGGGFGGFFATAIGSMMGGGGGAAGGAFTGGSFMVAHEGGVVGSVNRSRVLDPSAFVGAPRYHTGGISGMAANEYPAILEKNEEVITRNDPRHVMNGGGRGGNAVQTPQNIKVLNMIDSTSVLKEALATTEGTKVIVNWMNANKSAVKMATS